MKKYMRVLAILILLCSILFCIMIFSAKTEGFENPQRVVVSLTTSPKRIHTIETTLKSLTAQTRKPDVIYLHLPNRFARTNEEYTIPAFLTNYPLVQVHRVPEDEGPITKLSPTLRIEKDPNTIIIITDDDTEYRPTLIEDILAEMERHSTPTVVANGCRNDIHKKPAPHCELPEGWAGIGFKRFMFGDDFDSYLKSALTDTMCVKSDDLVIGNYLHMHNIPSINLAKHPKELSFAKQPDALSIIDVDDKDRYTPCRKHLKSINMYAQPK